MIDAKDVKEWEQSQLTPKMKKAAQFKVRIFVPYARGAVLIQSRKMMIPVYCNSLTLEDNHD